jgi:hypothetical protein
MGVCLPVGRQVVGRQVSLFGKNGLKSLSTAPFLLYGMSPIIRELNKANHYQIENVILL